MAEVNSAIENFMSPTDAASIFRTIKTYIDNHGGGGGGSAEETNGTKITSIELVEETSTSKTIVENIVDFTDLSKFTRKTMIEYKNTDHQYDGTVLKTYNNTQELPLYITGEIEYETENKRTSLYFKWEDLSNDYVGEYEIPLWDHVVLVRKVGSEPQSVSDGTTVVSSSTRNAYKDTAYVDSNLTLGTNYIYKLFTVTTVGVEVEGPVMSLTPSKPALDPISVCSVIASPTAGYEIKWTDPEDKILGDGFAPGVWQGTVLVRKLNSAPTSLTDGTILVNSLVRNQYSTTGFTDSAADLTDGNTYFYALFPYTEEEIYSQPTIIEKQLPTASWSEATDEEVEDMINAAYQGAIDLSDYWSSDEVRTIDLSEIATTEYCTDTHDAQQVDLRIGKFGYNDLSTAIGSNTKAMITVHQDGALTGTTGYMHHENNSSVGWYNCDRRDWCNSSYYNALPAYIKRLIKQVDVVTMKSYDEKELYTTQDYIFLPSTMELFNAKGNAILEEGTAFDYYPDDSARRRHYEKGTSNNREVHLRSKRNSSSGFCSCSTSGSNAYNTSNTATYYFAPCFAL